jgi:hypothetical protein
MKVARVDTWAAGIKDKPGAAAEKLAALARAGVNLEFVIARRAPDRPGKGVVFVTPVRGRKRVRSARKAGFSRSSSLHTLRVEGPDRAGQGARITRALAAAGLNLRGLSAAAIGRKFIAHVALDTARDAARGMKVLKGL